MQKLSFCLIPDFRYWIPTIFIILYHIWEYFIQYPMADIMSTGSLLAIWYWIPLNFCDSIDFIWRKTWRPWQSTTPMYGAWHQWSLIARFMGPTWGPAGAGRTQVGPMLAPWTLLSGIWNTWGHPVFDLWGPDQRVGHGVWDLTPWSAWRFCKILSAILNNIMWLSARLQYLQCVSNGDNTVLH